MNDVSIVGISEPLGKAPNDPDADALVVSEETLSGGHEINILRRKNGLTPLQILVAPTIRFSSGKTISSTYIREKVAEELEN